MNDLIRLILGFVLGFVIFTLTSNPRSRIHKKLPHKQFKNISILPHIKVNIKNRQIWLHHWFNLSMIYMIVIVIDFIRVSIFIHGIILGGIVQGLLLAGRFSFIRKVEREIVKNTKIFQDRESLAHAFFESNSRSKS